MELSIPGKSVFIQGSNGSPAMKFFWPFPDFFVTKSQFLLTFCSMKIWYFDGHTNAKNYCSDDLAKKVWFIISCAVLTKSWHNLQNVKYYEIFFIDYLAFLVGNCKTEQQHDIDSQNLKWGLHIDINSIFPDFLLNFKISWHISKFIDFFLNF